MKMYTIFGIIVVALGTYLIYLGTTKSDKEAQNEMNKKIEETQKKIDELKSDPYKDSSDIIKIENEFSNWAENFLKNKHKKKIDLEKTNLSVEEERINQELIWKPQLEKFFNTIKLLLTAYNEKSGDSITYKIATLPENLFNSESKGYEATIKFRNNNYWLFKIEPASTLEKKTMVTFYLKIYDNKNLSDWNALTDRIYFVIDNSRIQLVIVQNDRLNIKNIKEIYEFDENTFSKIANDLIENQLIQI